MSLLFFLLFFGKPELRNFNEHRNHGRRWPWPLYPRPRPEDARSRATCLLPTSWATPHPLGLIKFIKGGEFYVTIHQGDLRGLSLPQHGATDIASTAAHGRKTPVLGQQACCPHHGRLPTRLLRSNSSRGGRPVPGQHACCPHLSDSPTARFVLIRGGGVGIDPLGYGCDGKFVLAHFMCSISLFPSPLLLAFKVECTKAIQQSVAAPCTHHHHFCS